jgi:hypothetical protein
MTEHLEFSPPMIDELRGDYEDAVRSGAEEFTFHGHRLLTGYAKYLLEYLDNELRRLRRG